MTMKRDKSSYRGEKIEAVIRESRIPFVKYTICVMVNPVRTSQGVIPNWYVTKRTRSDPEAVTENLLQKAKSYIDERETKKSKLGEVLDNTTERVFGQ